MSVEERLMLFDALIAAGLDPARMMPGTGCCSLTETVKLTAHIVRHGCAGVLMLPPFYYKQVSDDGLFRYFSEAVQRVGDARLRIYLYHIPPVAMVGITPKLVERLLSAYPGTIAGMKDSSGDWSNTKTFLDAFGGDPSGAREGVGEECFDVFVGSETFLLENMRRGGAGCISATANVNPSAIAALYEQSKIENRESKISDSASLDELQSRLNVVREVFARKSWPSMIAALKQAIAIYRKDPEWARVRPPLIEFSAEQAKELEEEIADFELRIAN